MIGFGFGEIAGATFLGYLIDKYGSRTATFVNACNIAVTIVVTLLSIHKHEFNYLTYVMCFMWGYQDGGIIIHTC